MTPLQKRRHSTMRQGKRRATIRLVLPQLIECANCHQPPRPHVVCPHCGFYHGRDMRTRGADSYKGKKVAGTQ